CTRGGLEDTIDFDFW
nr:immunoglobulin heavy chain junction region [Macaca mulatta]